MEDSDAAQVERARAGDSDAFRCLVERHSRDVFRVAFRMTGNEQDAEDLVQETFLRAYRQIGKFDSRARFATWLYRIAMNCSLDLLRARRRRREADLPLKTEAGADIFDILPSGDPSPERLAVSRQLERRLEAALGTLSPAERVAFTMRHFEGVAIGEISRALGTQDGATRHSVFRAAQKLRRALAPAMGARP
jgi:RNA polymerase sigma-70 factor (ECF subfamily)